MIKYACRISHWGLDPEIKPIEVERETDNSVWVKGKRQAKKSDGRNYYDTWQEAHSALLDAAVGRVDNLTYAVKREQKKLYAIENMVE